MSEAINKNDLSESNLSTIDILYKIIFNNLSKEKFRIDPFNTDRKIKRIVFDLKLLTDNNVNFTDFVVEEQLISKNNNRPSENDINNFVEKNEIGMNLHHKFFIAIYIKGEEHGLTSQVSLIDAIKDALNELKLYYKCITCNEVKINDGYDNKCFSCHINQNFITSDNTLKCSICFDHVRKVYNKINLCTNKHTNELICGKCIKNCNGKCPICRKKLNINNDINSDEDNDEDDDEDDNN
jgi:hypothetical protein